MNREIPGLAARLYIWYRTKIFPWARKYRGATRLKRSLEKIATRDIEKVENGQPVSQREWDNLIILDACRYDIYQDIIGDAESRISAASMSQGFIRENFCEGDWSDTVVVTANPFYQPELFSNLAGRSRESVFDTVFDLYQTDWNDQWNTVLPEAVAKKAVLAEKLFPEKRKIIHFMQPHYPFINSEFNDRGYNNAGEDAEQGSVWWDAMRGDAKHEDVVEAYKRNLKQAEDPLEAILNELEGKTAITADHGNLVGEKGLYGHPDGLKLKPLRKVPWDVNDDEKEH